MSMGQHDALDGAEINSKLTRIAFERVSFRPGVEQNRVREPAALRRDQAG
jgi:hypothetical protein